MQTAEANGEAGAREEHYRLMQSRSAEQREHQREVHGRLTAALQLDSIIAAVLIAVILVQADRADFHSATGIPAILGLGYLIGSVCCVVGGLLSRDLRVLPRPVHSRQAADAMGRTEYLIWAASEMQRAYEENAAKQAKRGTWATAALILAVVAAALAGITAIPIIVE